MSAIEERSPEIVHDEIISGALGYVALTIYQIDADTRLTLRTAKADFNREVETSAVVAKRDTRDLWMPELLCGGYHKILNQRSYPRLTKMVITRQQDQWKSAIHEVILRVSFELMKAQVTHG